MWLDFNAIFFASVLESPIMREFEKGSFIFCQEPWWDYTAIISDISEIL